MEFVCLGTPNQLSVSKYLFIGFRWHIGAHKQYIYRGVEYIIEPYNIDCK